MTTLELLIKIGFLDIRLIDIIDVLLVAFLLFQLYRLLRGTLAVNIFIGILLIYLVWFVVQALDMRLLEGILGQFIGVGVIALLIVFQPEVRRFLLYLGRSSTMRRTALWRKMTSSQWESRDQREKSIKAILAAMVRFSISQTGALIVLSESSPLQAIADTGVMIEGRVSAKLIESLFHKESPLHDGAVIISDHKIVAAGCVLPVSENSQLPSRIGLRHRAAVGITENTDSVALIVSEQTGEMSYAKAGRLFTSLDKDEMRLVLRKFVQGD